MITQAYGPIIILNNNFSIGIGGAFNTKLKMRTTGATMVAIKKRIDRVNWPLAGIVYSAEPRVHV